MMSALPCIRVILQPGAYEVGSDGDAGVALRVSLELLGQEPLELGPAATAAAARATQIGDRLDIRRAGGHGRLDGAIGHGPARADVHRYRASPIWPPDA